MKTEHEDRVRQLQENIRSHREANAKHEAAKRLHEHNMRVVISAMNRATDEFCNHMLISAARALGVKRA